MTEWRSCLYLGAVRHQRVRPRRHRLDYRVFSMLIDLDELPMIARELRSFAHNRFGVYSFFDRDHGPGENRALRPWVEEQLGAADINLEGGSIRLLCYPRILGYVFNPLSVYFCHRRDGALAALLYEVNNTFGERHGYLIPTPRGAGAEVRQECVKRFYVSPFIAVGGRYRFRVTVPGDTLSLAITQVDAEGPLLHATFQARRALLDDGALARCFARYPLLTLKVAGGIHWEALRLWRKGVPLAQRPPPPPQPVTIVSPAI